MVTRARAGLTRARSTVSRFADAMDRWWPTIAILVILGSGITSSIAVRSAHRAASQASRTANEAKALASSNRMLAKRAARLETNLAAETHAAIQQNVNARFDDCESGNDLRKGLRTGVEQSKTTTPLLLKLVPALNTPQVRALIHASDKRQLRAYRPRPGGCAAYALRSVAAKSRRFYSTP